MNDRTLRMVHHFHDRFQQPIGERPQCLSSTAEERRAILDAAMTMTRLSEELLTLCGHYRSPLLMRLHLCQEELSELAHAMAEENLVEQLDALCDMRYVADGTTVVLGMHEVFDEAMDEVQASNMSKLDEKGQPILSPEGRVKKGPLFRRPDLHGVLARHMKVNYDVKL